MEEGGGWGGEGRAGREVWGKSKEGRGRRVGVGGNGKDRSGGRVRGGAMGE